MLNSLEYFLYKHGAYWAVALIAVTLSKLYTDEEQSMRSIIRSTLMASASLARHRRISESLFALALVEPTQYVTHDVSIPDTCPAM